MIISLLAAFILADLFAFYVFSAVFDYSWQTAFRVAYFIFGYVLVASWLAYTKQWAQTLRYRFLAKLHTLLRRWMWLALGLAFLGSVLLQVINSIAAPVSQHYVEVVNAWDRQGIRTVLMGSDSFSKPVPVRSPVLRDIQSGEMFYAFDDDDSLAVYRLLRNRGLEIDDAYCQACPIAERILQARVSLRSNGFGKYHLVEVKPIEFDALPRSVQESVVSRMGNSRRAVLPLWHLREQYPDLRVLIDSSLATASAMER